MLGFQGFSVLPFSTVTPFTATVRPVDSADAMSFLDAYAVPRMDWGPTQAEIITLIDDLAVIFNANPIMEEVFSIADTTLGFKGQFGAVEEVSVLTETNSTQVIFAPTLLDEINLLADSNVTWDTYASNIEQLTLLDESIGRILWLLELEYAKRGKCTAIVNLEEITVNAELYYDIKAT